MHLCLQQQRPQWVSEFAFPTVFKKQAGGNYKITHDQQHVSINVNRQKQTTSPNGKEEQPSVHGGSISSLPMTGSAAICTNAILGFHGSMGVDQGSRAKSISSRVA